MAWNSLSASHQPRFPVVLLIFLAYAVFPSAATSAPTLFDVSIVELAGRPGHQGLFPLQDQPIKGSRAFARARLIGGASNVKLLLLDTTGNVLSSAQMVTPTTAQAVAGTYFADVVIPNQPFTFAVTGNDESAKPFSLGQSGSPAVIPQTMRVRLVPAVAELSRSLNNLITVQVTNFGAKDTINVTLGSQEGGSATPSSAQVVLDSQQTASVSFDLSLPPSAETVFTLKATASSAAIPSTGNTASLRLPVAVFRQERLVAWFDEDDKKLRDTKVDVLVCDVGIRPGTIVLANDAVPLSVTRIPPERDDTDRRNEDRKHDEDGQDCGMSSKLKLSFDAASVLAEITSGIFPTQQRRGKLYVALPLLAFGTDGTQLIGSVAVRVQRTRGGDDAR